MRTLLLAMFLIGCGGGSGGGDDDDMPIDAPAGQIDAPMNLPACAGAAYEACTDNTQCTSQQCRLFMGDGIQVCTQNCDASNPCPDFDGTPVACNMMGRCKPPGQHMCMR